MPAQPVARVQKKSENDRRRSERTPHVVEAWIWSPTATDPADRLEVSAINLSRHGVAFECKSALPVGTFHMIDVAIGEQRLQAEIRIISSRKNENSQSEIGAEFC